MRGDIKFWIGNAVIVEADSEKLICFFISAEYCRSGKEKENLYVKANHLMCCDCVVYKVVFGWIKALLANYHSE